MKYDPSNLPIRADLASALERAWSRLAASGTWWSGKERLAIIAEARNGASCKLCKNRGAVLSPNMVQGEHDHLGILPENIVDLVHRLATDSGRLTQSWYRSVLANGICDGEYVEIVSVVNMISALDTFNRALGSPLQPIPEPKIGVPTRHRPVGATDFSAWVPTVMPNDLTDDDPDPYTQFHAYNIQLALGLVPQEVINFFDLDTNLYLTEGEIADLTIEKRAISRVQMEIIASRGASINGCHYCATCHTLHLHKLSQAEEGTFDLSGVLSGATSDNGVAHGQQIIAFVDAVLGDNDAELDRTRAELYETLGVEGFVDAAATVASFNSIVRVANATGTELDRLVTGQLEQITKGGEWMKFVPEKI